MVKIYREDNSVIIEGAGEFQVKTTSFSVENEIVTIWSDGIKKSVYNATWQIIADKEGNVFASANDLITYLNQVFNYSEIDFLSHYILNRNS